jgi:hypothetical protein
MLFGQVIPEFFDPNGFLGLPLRPHERNQFSENSGTACAAGHSPGDLTQSTAYDVGEPYFVNRTVRHDPRQSFLSIQKQVPTLAHSLRRIQSLLPQALIQTPNMGSSRYDEGSIACTDRTADEAAQDVQKECIVCIQLNNMPFLLMAERVRDRRDRLDSRARRNSTHFAPSKQYAHRGGSSEIRFEKNGYSCVSHCARSLCSTGASPLVYTGKPA